VPTDFDWPINKTWQGYLTPDELLSPECSDCGGRGTTPARQAVEHVANLLLMLDDDRAAQARGQALHPYFGGYLDVRPSADVAAFGTGLAGREAGFIGHDAVDRWSATEKVIRAAGLDPQVWGICPTCEGHGNVERYPGQRAAAEAWEPTDPPTGGGWQLWETVSEGSPISPVFADADGLIDWLCSPAYSWGGPMERESAARFVRAGWAPSLVFTPATGVVPGEQWVGSQ
jgi:hypothetical protein